MRQASGRGAWLQILAATAMTVSIAETAIAQPSSDLQTQIRQTYEQLLSDPGNVALTYRYAQMQIQAGNFEAAAGALEQFLILNPNQPQLKFELGALYVRMGSPQTALPYLREAAAAPDLPAELRPQVEAYLAEAERRTRRSQLSGDVTIGMRFDSNANLVPASNQLYSRGIQVPSSVGPRSDFAGIFIGRANHVWDFGNNDETALVSTAYAYGTRQINVDTSNIALVEITSGLRFKPLPNLFNGATMRPHVIANVIGLTDRLYSYTFGGGVDISLPLSDRLNTDFTYQYRSVDYRNIPSRPTSTLFNGHENQVRTRVNYRFRNTWYVYGEISTRFVRTEVNYLDFDEYGATLGTSFEYTVGSMRPWLFSAYVTYYHRPYDAPDPAVDPTRTRRENEIRTGIANVIPVWRSVALVQQVDYLKTFANIPNYARDNVSVMLGAIWRF